jgi:hypothetical protein
MSRRVLSVVIVACSTIILAGCKSSGTHTQSYSPSATDSSASRPSSPAPTASASTRTSSSPTRTTGASSISTPTVAPAAQAAVNAYIGLGNEVTAASRDPKHADFAAINRYLTGKARTLFDNSIKSMASAGQAYRALLRIPA